MNLPAPVKRNHNPMKLIPLFLAVGLAPWIHAATPPVVEVASAEGLRAEGVTCRRVELQALTSSIEIDVTIDASRSPGVYVGAECVVRKENLPAEGLAAADTAAADGATVARRARSNKPNPVFLVLGREIPRTYLAFEFADHGNAAGAVTHRYLLPVSAIKEAPAENRSDSGGAESGPGTRDSVGGAAGPP